MTSAHIPLAFHYPPLIKFFFNKHPPTPDLGNFNIKTPCLASLLLFSPRGPRLLSRGEENREDLVADPGDALSTFRFGESPIGLLTV